MNKNIQKYIYQNLSVIVKLLVIYAIGIVIGIILFNFSQSKQECIQIVKNIFESTKQENFKGINLIYNGIKNNVVLLSLLYMSLITIVTPFLVSFLLMIKGAMTGMYIVTIFSIFGLYKGILVFFLAVLIPNIISLCAYIFSSTNIISLFQQMSTGQKVTLVIAIKQLYWCVISLSLLCLSVIVEQLISGVIIRLYINI